MVAEAPVMNIPVESETLTFDTTTAESEAIPSKTTPVQIDTIVPPEAAFNLYPVLDSPTTCRLPRTISSPVYPANLKVRSDPTDWANLEYPVHLIDDLPRPTYKTFPAVSKLHPLVKFLRKAFIKPRAPEVRFD